MYFHELATYFHKLDQTASRIAMTEILAELFGTSQAKETGKLCYLLQGRVAPLYEPVEFGIAEKMVIRAIAQSFGVSEKTVVKEFARSGDLGTAAQNCFRGIQYGTARHLSISQVHEKLTGIAQMNGTGSQDKKISLLAELLSSGDGLAARYVVRIVLDKLRLGFSDMTILDGLSWMLSGDKSLKERLEQAYNVRPDIGYIAQTVKEKGIEGLSHIRAKVGVPILASLCQRLPTAEEMIKKMGTVAVEPKYDGVRVQIHFQRVKSKDTRAKIKTFSRNLENTTAMFPELEDIGNQLNAREVILDCEAVGVDPKTGKIVSFQETTTRKRKHDIAKARKMVPLQFFVFDILYKDGEDLLSTPLRERRIILEKTVNHGKLLLLSPQIVTTVPEEIRLYQNEQVKKGLEGAVVKKWESPYEPGRRGYAWVKFKEQEGKTGKLKDTIDAVIMGYYRGEGKRTGFGIGAFLVGIRKNHDFVTVSKVGTGVSDDLWKDLLGQLSALKANTVPKEYRNVDKLFTPDVWVEPRLVAEVAGDDLTKSKTHGAGIAIRFPRLVRIRHDKSINDVTTAEELAVMYKNQGV